MSERVQVELKSGDKGGSNVMRPCRLRERAVRPSEVAERAPVLEFLPASVGLSAEYGQA